MLQSEDAVVADRSQKGEKPEEPGAGEEGVGGEEEEVEKTMDTPTGPVYCLCRKPDINCFMM